MMRRVLTLCSVFHVFAGIVLAQTSENSIIQFSSKSMSVKSCLDEISRATGYSFSYIQSAVPLNNTLSVQNGTLHDVLKSLCSALNIAYKMQGKKILLFRKNAFTVSGYIIDKKTGEPLIGANIYNTTFKTGTTANDYGYYSLSLPADSSTLMATYVGYKTFTIHVRPKRDTTIQLALEGTFQLEEVIVTDRFNELLNNAQMSNHVVSVQAVKQNPALLGEGDLCKTLQTLPGIKMGLDGTSTLYVRGGNADQNLMLLDGVPVYNSEHALGLFSIVNEDAVNHMEMIKGNFHARYAGRLSSILDIRMREGNTKKIQTQATVSPISAKVAVDGPVSKNTSFLVSYRHAFPSIWLEPLLDMDDLTVNYYFMDFYGKINTKIDAKNQLFLSIYKGGDGLKYSQGDSSVYSSLKTVWGNTLGTLRWNRLWNPHLFSNTTISYSRYNYRNIVNTEEAYRGYRSALFDVSAKTEFEYFTRANHEIVFGIQATRHHFSPRTFQIDAIQDEVSQKATAIESGVYFESDFKIHSSLRARAGCHLSGFTYNQRTTVSPQPRFSLHYLITPKVGLSASYSRMTQYLYNLANSAGSFPSDLWMPGNDKLKPQFSEIIETGIKAELSPRYTMNISAYTKSMKNIIDINYQLDIVNKMVDDDRSQLRYGDGVSRGVELMLVKSGDVMTGTLCYTLSRSDHHFPQLNNGRPFPFKYDRRHELNLSAQVKLTKSHKKERVLSFHGIVASGSRTTILTQYYSKVHVGDVNPGMYSDIPAYNARNSFQLPLYRRGDIQYYATQKKKWGARTWAIGITNIDNYKNVVSITDNDENYSQISIMPILPYINYSLNF